MVRCQWPRHNINVSATSNGRLLVNSACISSKVFFWSSTWFYYQLSFESTAEWDHSAFVSWPRITRSWKSCEKTWWGANSTAHRMAEKRKKRLAGFIFVCQIQCPYTGDKFYGALWGLLQLSEHRIPQKEAWCLLLHKGPSRLDSGLNAVSRKENFLLGESLWWGQVTPSSWREYVSTMTQKAPDAIENTSSF